MSDFELIIFDLDGTLSPFDSDELYPDADAWLAHNQHIHKMIATNQGGIGLRHWMEKDGFGDPEKYPTLESFEARIAKLFPHQASRPVVLYCARYQSKKSGKWCPVPAGGDVLDIWREDWRKPATGMLEAAMSIAMCYPQQTLVVGDEETDKQAAEAANCSFQWAWEFFGRDKP